MTGLGRSAFIGILLAVGLGSLLFLVPVLTGSSHPVGAGDGAQTSVAQPPVVVDGAGAVPADVLQQIETRIDSKYCSSGGFDRVRWTASTTVANALLLEPANSSISSFAGGPDPQAAPDTPIYDVLFSGNCASVDVKDRRVGQMEVMFFVSASSTIVVTGERGTWADITPPAKTPFGTQFEDCQSDAGCSG